MPTNERTITIYANNTLTLRFDLNTAALGPSADLSTYTATWWLGEPAYYGPGPHRAARQLIRKETGPDSVMLIQDAGEWSLFVKLDPSDTANVDAGVYHQEAALTGPNGEFYTVTLGDVRLTETAIR